MKTCLIVDDSIPVRRIVRQMLEPVGYACIEAANGREALEACHAAMPDLVILDWNMPVMDGIECLEQLRAMPGAEVVRVIVCTTENDSGHMARAVETGADEYIMKPFDAGILHEKLRQVGCL